MSDKATAVGVTGSRHGPSVAQAEWLEKQLESLRPSSLHHGDCVGVDAVAHETAARLGIATCAHPPIDLRYRAFCDADETRAPRAFLDRNHDIVDEVSVLLALPMQPEHLRSGTWATVRYAQRHGVNVVVCMPDGAVEER